MRCGLTVLSVVVSYGKEVEKMGKGPFQFARCPEIHTV